MAESNTLYYGDNLDILRRYVADESVDLIYLDPPFNSCSFRDETPTVRKASPRFRWNNQP